MRPGDWSISRGSFCPSEHPGHAGRASASLPINRITAELWCMGRNHHAASAAWLRPAGQSPKVPVMPGSRLSLVAGGCGGSCIGRLRAASSGIVARLAISSLAAADKPIVSARVDLAANNVGLPLDVLRRPDASPAAVLGVVVAKEAKERLRRVLSAPAPSQAGLLLAVLSFPARAGQAGSAACDKTTPASRARPPSLGASGNLLDRALRPAAARGAATARARLKSSPRPKAPCRRHWRQAAAGQHLVAAGIGLRVLRK